MPAKYTGVQTDVFVVMPHHLHGIIKIENTSSVGAAPSGRPLPLSNETANCLADDIDKGQIDKKRKQYEGQPQGVAPTDKKRMSLSDIVHRFKSFTTHLYSKGVKEQGWVPFPGRLGQRNYYERVIRIVWIDVHELWDRAGPNRAGYISPEEMINYIHEECPDWSVKL